MRDIYIAKTKIGKREMSELMKAETWLTAKEAKEKGFIDTILEAGKPAKAQFDLSMFANTPADVADSRIVNQEPTVRDAERALRDVGFSQNTAKAMLAGSAQAKGDQEEIETLKAAVNNFETKAALQTTITHLRG
jgi:enoyl-CoA hydratase/carnithine racemase